MFASNINKEIDQNDKCSLEASAKTWLLLSALCGLKDAKEVMENVGGLSMET